MNLTNFHFIRPYWLLALLPAMVLLMAHVRHNRPAGLWSEVCDAALLPILLQQRTQQQGRMPLIAIASATLLAIIALAGPTWKRLPSPVFSNQSALVIALDLSLSMNAADVAPSRLIRARYKIADILKRRKDGQTALLVYSGDAFTVTPLTNDTETIDSQLSALSSDIMPSSGSNLAAALQKAAALLKQAGLAKGQILLVTDGVAEGSALSLIEQVEPYTVSVLGVGTAEGGPIKAAEGDFVKDAQGTIVIPKLDAKTLMAAANAGKGIYTPLTEGNQDVEQLSDFFEQAVVQQESENKALLLQQWAERGPWLLLAVLPLAALSFRKGLLSVVLVFLLPLPKASYALEWQDLWRTKDQQALQAFQQQDFTKAAEQFKNPEWQAAAQYKAGNYQKTLENLKPISSADSFYNQGNALAQAGQLPEAIKAYEQALKLKPDDADAKFNKELVEKELKKQQEEQQKQEQQKQQDQQQPKDQQKQQDQAGQSKPGQNQDKKDKENASEQADNDQSKPEQQQPAKDAQQNKEQDAKASEQKPEPQKPEKDDKSAEQKQQAAQVKKADEQKSDDKKPEAQATAPVDPKQDESKQANEQWLKRIPDDPAGLLRRKFKYQYGRQERPAPLNGDPW